MLKYRILTALILIPLVILGVYLLPPLYFSGVCALIIALAAWEWAPLLGWKSTGLRLLYVFIILLALIISLLLISPFIIIVTAALWWFAVLIGLFSIRKKPQLPMLPRWAIACMGILILIPCWQALVIIRGHHPNLLLYMLLIVWVADTAAYFGGRRYGKNPLALTISPNKTMEGARIGFIAAALVALIGAWLFMDSGSVLNWISVGIPAIIASIVGDLFESFLKRLQGVKDSGGLLPGHGGLLDRIDSLLAAAPVFACGVLAMGLR